MHNTRKKILLSILTFMSPFILWAQEVKIDAAAAVTESTSINLNILLTIVAILLLLPLYISSKTYLSAISGHNFNSPIKESSKKIISILLLMLFSTTSIFAQATATDSVKQNGSSVGTVGLIILTVIVLEIICILFFNWQTNKFLTKAIDVSANEASTKEKSIVFNAKFNNLWSKMNSFKPMEEEASLDTGHSYDGIRELNNVTPPWFTFTFALSILFAIVYLYQHHVSHTEPLQIEEYNIAMKEGEDEKATYLALAGNNIDENSIKMLDATEITAGQATFKDKCVACHGPNGGSAPGGVGPNLTDDHWIHGGTIKDVFKSIKYGWPEKGMISWKEQLSPKQIAQLASFVKSIKGTVKTGGKDPQGDLFAEDGSGENTAPSKDSSVPKLAPDTAKSK